MTDRPSAGKPGGPRLGDDERLTLRVIASWRQTAADEVDDIGGWRDADPSDRLHKYWSDPARHRGTEQGSTMPNSLFGDTGYLLGWAVSNHEKLDATPLQDIYDAIAAWHDDHNAERVPEQRMLFRMLDRAVQVVQAMENAIRMGARRTPSDATGWQADRDRLRYLVREMKHRIAGAAAWGRMSEVLGLQTEAETLAIRLGFPGAPLVLIWHRQGEAGFESHVPVDVPDAVAVLEYIQHDPLGAFSTGIIGCTRPGEVGGEPCLIEVDHFFGLWKPDAIKSLEAWERAIDGMRVPKLPAAGPTHPAPKSGDWEATLRRVHDLVRSAPQRFREAGEWLDTEYGEEAVRERYRRSQAGESTGHFSASHTSCTEPGRDTRFWRLNCVGSDWRAEPPNLSMRSLDEPRVWAERVLLYICLVTDREAGEYAAALTELASLPWEKGADGDLGRGWCDPDDIWDGKEPWRDLVVRATVLLSRDTQPTPPSMGTQRQSSGRASVGADETRAASSGTQPVPEPRIGADQLGELLAALVAVDNRVLSLGTRVQSLPQRGTAVDSHALTLQVQDQLHKWIDPILQDLGAAEAASMGVGKFLAGLVDGPLAWEVDTRLLIRSLREQLVGFIYSNGAESEETLLVGIAGELFGRGQRLQAAHEAVLPMLVDAQTPGPEIDAGGASPDTQRSLSPNEQAVWDCLHHTIRSAEEIAEHCGFRTADQARNCIAGIRSKRGTGVLVSRRGGGYYRPDAEPSQEELSRPRPRRSRTAPR